MDSSDAAPESGYSRFSGAGGWARVKRVPYGPALIWLNAVPVAVAILDLVGWATGIRFLTSIRDIYYPMPPSVAVAILLTTGSLLTATFWMPNAISSFISRSVNLILMAFSLVILYELVTETQPRIEERLFGISGTLNDIPVGRMSPIAAVMFFIANLALLFLHLGKIHFVCREFTSLMGLFMLFTGSVTTLGYLYGTPLLYGGGTRPVALGAGFALGFLGAAIVLAAGSEAWPLRLFTGDRVRPRLLRAFLPIVVAFMLIEGWLNAITPDDFALNPVYVAAFLAIAFIIPATYLISRSARRIGGEIDRADTARDVAEAQVRKVVTDLKRSNSELEQFAYVASHDLQEPLRMVSSYVQLLEKRYSEQLDDDAREFIGFAVDGANRMKELINDLLALSRVGTRGNSFKPVAVVDAVAAAENNLRLAIEDSGVRITHDPLPVVDADLIQMTQLLQNLLENAIKFRGKEPPRIHITARRNDGEWEFCVSDNGIGFDKKFADRIFVIFQRLHGRESYEGTGIGLAICRKIVERHGGRIWAESEPGKGSDFYFTLPVVGAV